MAFVVRMNGRGLVIDDYSVEDFESRVLAAIAAGGAFVEVAQDGALPVRVLVTPASSVSMERQTGVAEAEAGDTQFTDLSYLDLDLDF